jgi:hypothetical protein
MLLRPWLIRTELGDLLLMTNCRGWPAPPVHTLGPGCACWNRHVAGAFRVVPGNCETGVLRHCPHDTRAYIVIVGSVAVLRGSVGRRVHLCGFCSARIARGAVTCTHKQVREETFSWCRRWGKSPLRPRRYGEKTALVAGGRSFSFNLLEAQSNAFANGLVEAGVASGDIVTLYGPNSWQARSLNHGQGAVGALPRASRRLQAAARRAVRGQCIDHRIG